MTIALDSSAAWVARLPEVLGGRVGVHVLGPDGWVAHYGDDGTTFDGREPTLCPDRTARAGTVGDETVLVTLPSEEADGPLGDMVEGLLAGLAERIQLAHDLDSMGPSSLALLEEVSMWGEVLPILPTGRNEREVAEMGIRALIVAAGAQRAMYVRWHEDLQLCEILSHVVVDSDGHGLRMITAEAEQLFEPGGGIIGRAARGTGTALLAGVADLTMAEPVERLVEREVIAVPVRFGGEENTKTLGVVLVMDKRESSYSAQTELGSQETKLTQAVASMLGSVLGTRRMVELDKEFEMAEDIHRQLQPQSNPQVAGFDVAGRNRACGRVGGDYFDYLRLADGRTLAVVLDVSGHDFASGMMIVSARMALRLECRSRTEPDEVFTVVNQEMTPDLSRTERFVTSVGVAMANDGASVEIVNHGHPDTMILRAATGEVECVPSDAPVLGFSVRERSVARTAALSPGDVVLLYTDGVTEVTNASDDMFGFDELMRVLREVGHLPAIDIVNAVHEAVDRHRGAAPRSDDVTVLAIRATGGGA